MKLANSKNIKKLLEGNLELDNQLEVDETIAPGPCFEVKADRENGTLICLIDGEEQLTYNLAKVNSELITKEGFCHLISILKLRNLDVLRKELKTKK